jgi:hypothetical protein
VGQQVSAQDHLIERLPGLWRARMAVHINKTRQNKSGPGNRPGARYRTAADPAVAGPQLNGLAARQGHPADVQLHAATLKPATGQQPPLLPSAELATRVSAQSGTYDVLHSVGLSGGGCRSALLRATSEHLTAAVVVGMMSSYDTAHERITAPLRGPRRQRLRRAVLRRATQVRPRNANGHS